MKIWFAILACVCVMGCAEREKPASQEQAPPPPPAPADTNSMPVIKHLPTLQKVQIKQNAGIATKPAVAPSASASASAP